MRSQDKVPPQSVCWADFIQATDPASDPANEVGPGKTWVETDTDDADTQIIVAEHVWRLDDSGWMDKPTGSVLLTTNIRDVSPPLVIGHPDGSVLTTGPQLQGILIPCSGMIIGWTMTTDVSATCEVDVLAADFATWPTTTSLWGGSEPSITAARKNRATGLAIAVTAGDLWDVVLNANNNAKQIILNVTIRRS